MRKDAFYSVFVVEKVLTFLSGGVAKEAWRRAVCCDLRKNVPAENDKVLIFRILRYVTVPCFHVSRERLTRLLVRGGLKSFAGQPRMKSRSHAKTPKPAQGENKPALFSLAYFTFNLKEITGVYALLHLFDSSTVLTLVKIVPAAVFLSLRSFELDL